MPLSDLIAARFTRPLGLDHTAFDDGAVAPGDAQHGWFTLD